MTPLLPTGTLDGDAKKPRRQRAVIVCTNCRRRKIKCDKGKPCSNCVTSKCARPCEYDKPAVIKAEDRYTMELQLKYSNKKDENSETQKGPPGGVVSQFYVGNSSTRESQPRTKKPRSEMQSWPTTTDGDQSITQSDSSRQKSEIQILKERLEQIERSILGSDVKKNDLSSMPSSSSTISSSMSMRGSLSTNGEFYSTKKPIVFPNQGAGLSKNSPMGYLPSTSDRVYNSLLPPLNASFKLEGDRFDPVHSTKHEIVTPSSANQDSSYSLNSGSENINTIPSTYPTRFDSQRKGYLMIGNNIVGSPLDTMNFYEHYSSLHQKDDIRRINFGPFAWSSLMRRDQGLHLVWEHIKLKRENSVALIFANSTSEVTQENTNAILNYEKDSDQTERQFEKRALETDGIDEIIPYSSILKARKERYPSKSNLARTTFSLGVTLYDVQIGRQLDTIEKIKTVLPNKSIVWKLTERFFNSVYVYMPYLDEGYFKEDVYRILGPESHEDVPINELKIERKLDLAVVGILLVILRLSYLSLLSNNTSLTEAILRSDDPSPDTQKMKFLLANPISIDTINVATLCLDQFQFMRRANFTVLQLALYLRIYQSFAPEDGDGADGGGTQGLTAALLQMSYQLGLNREPDETCTNLRMNNLSRKIWYFVCLSDIHLASCFGNPLSTDDRFNDTKFPFFVTGGENLLEKSKDKTILDRYLGCGNMFLGTKDLLIETLDVKNRVSLPRLTSMLTTWEIEWYQHSGSLRDCLEFSGAGESSIIDRNFKIKTYLSSRSFLMTMYFHIYLYYEPNNIDVSFFYYKKCLLISTADVMPHYSSLLRNSEVVSDMIINPVLEMFIHKANMVYLSGIIRVNFVIYHLRESGDHVRRCANDLAYKSFFQKLCQLSSCLTRAAEYTISAINKISHRYYYAWRITKSQTVLLKNVTSTEFYRANYEKAYKLYCQRYSAAQLEELIYICERTLASFHNSEFSTFGFSQKADTQLSKSSNLSDSSSSLTPPDGVTDLEIDKLWLQILSWKHEVSGEFQHEGQSTGGNQMGDIKSTKYVTENEDLSTPGIPNHVNDPAFTTKLDIFSDMPFNDELYT